MARAAKGKVKRAKTTDVKSSELDQEEQARRDFLKKAGTFAVVTPPSIALLLGTSLNSQAIAASHGGRGLGKHGLGKKGLKLGRLGRKLSKVTGRT